MHRQFEGTVRKRFCRFIFSVPYHKEPVGLDETTKRYKVLIQELLLQKNQESRREYYLTHQEVHSLAFVNALKNWTDQRKRDNPQDALESANVTMEIAELLANDDARAIAALAQANVQHILGHNEIAIQLYNQAAQIYHNLGNELAEANAQIGKIGALVFLGHYDEAVQLSQNLRAIYIANGAKESQAKLDMNVGVLYARRSQLPTALTYLRSARALFAEIGDRVHQAMIDANRAAILAELNDFRKATDLYRDARQNFSEAGMSAAAAHVDQNVAYLLSAQGHYDQSLRLFEQTREALIQDKELVAVAVVDLDMSDVYLQLNLYDEAWAACDSAEPVFRTHQRMFELGRVLLNRALIQIGRDDLGKCAPLLLEAMRIFEDEGNVVWAALAQLNQAIYLLQTNREKEAVSLAQNTAVLFATHGLKTRECLALILAGDGYTVLGDWEQAEVSYRASLISVVALDIPWLTFRSHHGLGRVYHHRQAWEEAYDAYQKAVMEVEQVTTRINIEPHRIAFLNNKLAPYEDLILLCLDKQSPQLASEAFEYVERAKSRALVDLLSNNLSNHVHKRDETGEVIVANLERLREELNWRYNRINEQGMNPSEREPVLAASIWEEIRRLENQAGDLMRQLRVRYTDYLSLHQVPPISLETVSSCIADDGLLVEYYIARGETIAFTFGADGLKVYRDLMDKKQIRFWLDAFRFQINKFRYGRNYIARHQKTLLASVNRCLKALYDGLFAPIDKDIGQKPLVIVPHDLLHYLPFHALYDGHSYLTSDHEIYTAPSASVLQLCCKADYTASGPALLLGTTDPSIPHVLDEVKDISLILEDPRCFVGSEATREPLLAYGQQSSIVHIASHAFFRKDNPLFSAIRLADGWLNVNDIYELDIKPALVTLSGCETGMGSIANGDELIGLSRSFFYAGAPALVVSNWAVNDQATAKFMKIFYQELQSGKRVAGALRQAQIKMMAQYDHPYYWASFSAVGNAQVRLTAAD